MSIAIDRSPQLVQYFGATKDIASLTNISNVATIYRIQDGGYKVWDSANTAFASFTQLEEGVGYLIFSKSTAPASYTIDAADTSETLPQSTSVSDTIAIMRYSGDTVDLTVSENITNYDQIFLVDENGDYKSWSKANITNNNSSFNAFNELTNNETYLIFSDSTLTFPDDAYEFSVFIGDPNGILLYSVSPTTNSVKVIDSGNGVVQTSIDLVGVNPVDIVIDSVRGLAYVAASSNSSTIAVINLSSNTIICRILLNSIDNFNVTKIHLVDDKIFAISDASNSIIVIDTQTNSILETLSLPSSVNISDLFISYSSSIGIRSIYTLDSYANEIYAIENKETLHPIYTQIVGSQITNVFGNRISTNSQGDVIATISGINYASVFKRVSNRYIPLGFQLTAPNTISDLMLSDNGNRLVIGCSTDLNVDGERTGSVTIFEYDGSRWNKFGPTIFGDNALDKAGSTCAINEDGSVVAFSSPYENNEIGKISVFQWDNNTENWIKLGNDIIGDLTEGVRLGSGDISLDSSGEIIAIGSNFCNNVKVYEYISNTSSWQQVGQTITGIESDDQFGNSIDLSSNGRILVSNSRFGDDIRVFEYDGSTGWEQRGNTIHDRHSVVKVSNDGQRILAGYGSLSTSSGKITVFEKSQNTWYTLDDPIYGLAPSDRFGYSVAMSRDGNIFFASYPGYDTNGDNIGAISSYTYSS